MCVCVCGGGGGGGGGVYHCKASLSHWCASQQPPWSARTSVVVPVTNSAPWPANEFTMEAINPIGMSVISSTRTCW